MQTILVLRTTRLECWPHKLAGINDFARRHAWRLQVIDCTAGPGRVAPLLAFWRPAGCIVEADGAASQLRPRDFAGTPVVFLDHSPEIVREGASVVRHDSARIAHLAARELLALDYPAYALIGWFYPSYWMQDKINAFQDVLSLHGKTAHLFCPAAPDRSNPAALQRHLQSWLAQLPRPCGIFGVNDAICGLALSAAVSLGLSIPEEMAFVGADDDALVCETATPSLSSVRPDFRQTGRLAAELLAERIAHPDAPARLRVVPPLRVVRRLSSRAFRRLDPAVKTALERIRRDAAAGLRARQVLDAFPCSRRQAEIRFRAATGRSVLEEIQDARLARALELLRNPDIALTAIADRSGWPSSLTLSRYVRRRFNQTLTQLRAAERHGAAANGRDRRDTAPRETAGSRTPRAEGGAGTSRAASPTGGSQLAATGRAHGTDQQAQRQGPCAHSGGCSRRQRS